eukprot:540712_1
MLSFQDFSYYRAIKWTATFAATATTAICCRFMYKAITDPMHIIWDLDATILASHLLPKCKDNFPAIKYPDYFDQIDDDFSFEEGIPNTRTWFRPYAKFTIYILSYFTVQHIFTSAQKTYTDNITNELIKSTGHNYFKVIKHRDLYPPKYLRKNGKNIYEIIGKNNEKLLKRSILFDDQIRYLKPHPLNGILVKIYKDINKGANDKEMIKYLGIIIICHLLNDVRFTLKLLGVNS